MSAAIVVGHVNTGRVFLLIIVGIVVVLLSIDRYLHNYKLFTLQKAVRI